MFFDGFYCFSGAFLRGEFRVGPHMNISDEYKLVRAEDMPSKPILFDWRMGKKITDLMPTTYAVILLISAKFVGVLNAAKITGWTTFPVVVNNKGERVEGYQGLAITGRCGPLDNSRSIQKRFPPRSAVSKPRLSWTGYYFDEDSWDGSDMFVPEGTGLIIVAEKVKELIVKNKLTNVSFELITEVERAGMPSILLDEGAACGD